MFGRSLCNAVFIVLFSFAGFACLAPSADSGGASGGAGGRGGGNGGGSGGVSDQGGNGSGGVTSTGGNDTGGSGGSGGATSSGSATGSGGRSAGGTNGTGGVTGSGGSSTGGRSGTGGVTGSGGSSTGGRSGTGGVTGSGGSSTGGRSGTGGATSVGGSGTGGGVVINVASTSCTITPNVTISSKIGTVGIVTFTTDLGSPTSGHIDFGLDTNYGMQAPIDTSAASYRTLLLGMKQKKTYHYRIVVANASGQCTGGDNTLTTNALPNGMPAIMVTNGSGARAGGFLNSAFFKGQGGGTATGAFILDADGEYVWIYGSGEMGRAEMSYDGKYMYYASVNAQGNSTGSMHRVTMDGLTEEDLSAAVSGLHHDFTTGLPDGSVGLIRRIGSADWVSEWKDGKVTDKFDVTAHFGSGQAHANSIHYHADDDSYTVADRNFNALVKASRSGTKAWKLGGSSSSFTGDVTWSVNHGHHWIAPNRIFLFNNGNSGASHAIELSLDLTAMKATKVWDYSSGSSASAVLGDVQILDNGNRLITFSTSGLVHELDGNKALVQSIAFGSGGAIGYAVKRPTLYGPPPAR